MAVSASNQRIVRLLVILELHVAAGVEFVVLEVTLARQLAIVGTELDLLDFLEG